MLDVTDGLRLEVRGVRLAWYSTLDELLASTTPDFVAAPSWASPPKTVLFWNDSVWGGLRCQVTTAFGDPLHPGPWLEGVRLVCDGPTGMTGLAAVFGWLQGQLTERFGPPESVRDDGEEGRALWRLGRVTLRHQYMDVMGGGHEVFLFV